MNGIFFNMPDQEQVYIRNNSNQSLAMTWTDKHYGNRYLQFDLKFTTEQTVPLYKDDDIEVVIELRPRRLTPTEREMFLGAKKGT